MFENISRTEYNASPRISYYSREMLDILLEQNILKTWTSFQEQSGNIVVKLKFYGTHCGQVSLNVATGDHQQKNTSPAYIYTVSRA